jgi:hypothetical protein
MEERGMCWWENRRTSKLLMKGLEAGSLLLLEKEGEVKEKWRDGKL